MAAPRRPRPLLPALLLGIGLGGFVDGIVLHQVLQWHHMVSDEGCCPPGTLEGLERNTLADGLFHAASWLVTAAGAAAAARAWRAGRPAPAPRAQAGALLAGWGTFNVLDSVVDHWLLGVHHVRDDLGGPLGWDLGFLAFALLLLAAGWALVRSAARAPAPGPPA